MTEFCKEIGEVWSRLFDHRPFLNGEIKYMLKEFEEKRGDREVENLFSILEKVTDVKDTQLEKIGKLSEERLPILGEKLNRALSLCHRVEEKSRDNQAKLEEQLTKSRAQRQVEWDQFMEDMKFKCKRIDNAFEEKEEELRDFYADLDHKLNITNINMDLKGQIVDTKIQVKPSAHLLKFIRSIPDEDNLPFTLVKLIKGNNYEQIKTFEQKTNINFELSKDELKVIEKLKNEVKSNEGFKCDDDNKEKIGNNNEKSTKTKIESEESDTLKLTLEDLDWLYIYLQTLRKDNTKEVPYLHELLIGCEIETPENAVIKRNPELEARCVKLRAQQEAREYRAMTKGVDNVRMRFPEDSISYQLKQLNRQLIGIGQFLLSIFAGFLFGFKGIELMIGDLDFGFRLLLGVMCALVIALAEIYFLAKKLNEELSVPETTQIGGPPKFANMPNTPNHTQVKKENMLSKEHQE